MTLLAQAQQQGPGTTLRRLWRHAPVQDNYPLTVVAALLALCPFLILTTAAQPLREVLGRDLHASTFDLELADGLANAGYAFGAVAAADFAQRFSQRALFLYYELVFILGSVLAVAAPNPGVFVAGRTLEGLATGLLLIGALPPIITRYPASKLPVTAVAVNVGLFGVTTLGPVLGGVVAQSHAWRLFLASLLGVGVLAFVVGLLAVQHQDPPNPDRHVDQVVFPLAVAATVIPFVAVAALPSVGASSPLFWGPLAGGVAVLVTLVVQQYHANDDKSLMPLKLLSTTLPVAGTLCAMVAGAVFVALLSLVEVYLAMVARVTPSHEALLLIPQIGGVVITAFAFGALLRTRWVPLLAGGGVVALIAAGALLLTITPGTTTVVVLAVAGLLGLGAGATVSPGLFWAALGVPSQNVGRAFAIVELLRSEAAFLVGPVLLYAAMAKGMKPAALATGIQLAVGISVGVAVLGLLVLVALYLLGRAPLRPPDIEDWLDNGEQALESPPVLAAVRGRAD